MLDRHALVICDETFLPLVPEAEHQSMIGLMAQHSNLVIIRSLTKLFGVAGLRVSYAITQPDRLKRWKAWRDPWPVNGIASVLTERWLGRPASTSMVQPRPAMDGEQGAWMQRERRKCRHHADAVCSQFPVDLRPPLLGAVAGSWSMIIGFCRDCRSFAGWVRHGFVLACNRLATIAVLFELSNRFSA